MLKTLLPLVLVNLEVLEKEENETRENIGVRCASLTKHYFSSSLSST